MKKLSLSDDIKHSRSNHVSKSFNLECIPVRKSSLSIRKKSRSPEGTMHIVEMWSKKMKK